MTTIRYCAPTAIYCLKNCLEGNSTIFSALGSRAFIITSRFAQGCPNLALDDIETVFRKLGIEYQVYSDVEENPSVESVVRVSAEIRSNKPDFIIAIGGGSALDTAKAANVLIGYPADADAYQVFYGGKDCSSVCDCGKLPMLAIPTTAGSGSDVMGFAILTRSDTNTKLRINQLSYFRASFLDARYVMDAPQWLLDAGAADALAHGIEGTLNVNSSPLSSLWINYGYTLFASFKDALIEKRLTQENCADMLLAASVQGMGNLQCGSTIPHGLGYALTHFKGVTHGIATIMVMPAFLRLFKNQRPVEDILHRCGFENLDEFELYIREIVRRNVNIRVSLKEIDEWAAECYSLKPRMDASSEKFSQEEIRRILISSLDAYIER